MWKTYKYQICTVTPKFQNLSINLEKSLSIINNKNFGNFQLQKGKKTFVARQNKCIRELLDVNGLEKCIVKAVRLIKLKEESSKDMIDRDTMS